MQGKSVTDIDWDAEIGKSGVESAAHIRRRAYQFLEDQCKANQDKLVLVVTHGSFIRYLFSMIDSKFDLKCPVKNGSISLVEYQKPFGYRNAGFNITEFE